MFSNLFNPDNFLWRALNRFAQLFYLNLLCMIFSLPIITIGASVTAMYTVTLKWAKQDEPPIFRTFLEAFKSNFKKSTKTWLIFLFIGIFIALDLFLTHVMTFPFAKVLFYSFIVAAVIYLMVLSYVFPLLSKFENTIYNTIKNAILMSIAHFFATIIIVVLNFFPYAVFFWDIDIFFLLIVPILLVCGFALIAHINTMLFHRIFLFYLPPAEDDSSEDDEDESEYEEYDTTYIYTEEISSGEEIESKDTSIQ